MTRDELLQTACHRTRKNLAKPFQMTWRGETWAAATNGHLLAATRGGGDLPEPKAVDLGKVLAKVPTTPPCPLPMAEFRALAKLADPSGLPPCMVCEGDGMMDCPACLGHGGKECTCVCGDVHDAECRLCGSNEGWVPCSCGRPKHTDSLVRVKIGNDHFGVRTTIAKALRFVGDEQATWAQDGVGFDHPALIETPTWAILVMPVRTDEHTGAPLATIELPECASPSPSGEPS